MEKSMVVVASLITYRLKFFDQYIKVRLKIFANY